ncbi:YbaK/EbsC family protein [Streptomyces ipomoeae]|jgi:prolyl-tRNA editing enzyme YbaK/EbsC (Cys-tRNA(Pro) deacylase)|uniref:YbaK/prolyl-tRNA synthetase-associated domain protein n=1 Tax=Streptomyces ipomoeae 91-03 TaxID=698759 RepID=L1KMF4_9ACTN|nr:YbaK/EbsC family protein [Streptomyces ipomoeae]EKX61729.1 YbaK/prolyl-tRNA synthetase-associated domain protein [Streptomyces ipomoeae 91-03]MDX2695348.1 YbaK/EbsC family protein [Streptomyces ipomoeae]MDX2820333.1 YbaK/EbsC family protein [Streptomyces ipomoeae]MDX2846328.1 YbaK/EbsC family protein [Streptomyces ipomoeae]MDX2876056.1 YbaK/EbsC family protein [Streptomyces ipomoeae]
MRAPIGDFDHATPAPDCLDDLVGPVADAVRHWRGSVPAEDILYVETDPRWADTAVFVQHYGQELLEQSANCVVVAGRRGGESSLAACVVPSTTRVDVNGVVRRQLGARKASFASMDTATGETGMEHGGITPVGLPEAWPVLVDSAVVELPYVLVGSGRRRGKLLVPGKAFAELPNAVVLEGLGGAS